MKIEVSVKTKKNQNVNYQQLVIDKFEKLGCFVCWKVVDGDHALLRSKK